VNESRQLTSAGKFEVHPQLLERGMRSQVLAKSEAMNFKYFVASHWGEIVLHKHPGSDAVWFVLGGEATFYGEDNKVIARARKNEGVFIPHDTPYWFESSSEENLVILRFGATADAAFGERAELLEERTQPIGKRDASGFFEAPDTEALAGSRFE
jgi:mannose-6-phosphate isomerase-like protein (cupin superfamily)